jgi:lipoteichoic acid synthase
MWNAVRARLARALERARSRAVLLELAPLAAFLLVVWIKASYFNLPPRETIENDWNGWRLKEAVQAGLSSLAALLLLVAPVLYLSRIPRYVVLWGVNLAVSLLVFADAIHFRFYGDVISVLSLSAAGQVTQVSSSILELTRPSDLLLFADLFVALALLPRYATAVRSSPPAGASALRPVARRMVAAGVLLILAIPVRIVALDRGDTFHYAFFRFFGVRKIGLLNYHLYEAGKQSLAVLGRYGVSDEERARALSFVEAWRDTATAPSPLFGVARGRNLILLVVESLQEFPLGLRIHGQEVAPNLTALAGRSMVFENFYDATWEGTSADGEFMALQSLHPLPAGAVQTRYPANQFRGLPRILAERGYATLSSSAYYGDLWRSRDVHPRFGFERSLFLENFQPGETINGALSDREFLRQVMPHIEGLPRPFMALAMTMSTHHPYPLPDRYQELTLGDLEGTVVGDYLHTVHYFDTVLGELLARLEASGLLDESVLVVYGDHKAPLGAPSGLSTLLERHAGHPARTPGVDPRYWQAEKRVPLIVHLPHDAAAGVRDVSGGHLDIAPTVLSLLGIEDHTMVTLGRDLTQGEHSFVVLRDGGFVVADTLCLVPDATRASRQCHDLRTGTPLDPGRFEDRFARARERLEVSDLMIQGNLIPTN